MYCNYNRKSTAKFSGYAIRIYMCIHFLQTFLMFLYYNVPYYAFTSCFDGCYFPSDRFFFHYLFFLLSYAGIYGYVSNLNFCFFPHTPQAHAIGIIFFIRKR